MTTFCSLQHTSLSPDGKLLVIVGDNPEGILVDAQTGKVLHSMSCRLLPEMQKIGLTNTSTFNRTSKTYVATWTIHLHQHGILMVSHLRRVAKTRRAGSGTSATSQNLWQS